MSRIRWEYDREAGIHRGYLGGRSLFEIDRVKRGYVYVVYLFRPDGTKEVCRSVEGAKMYAENLVALWYPEISP